MKPQRVIIIGGGIGGLSLAIALRNKGIVANVYEAKRDCRESGSGLVMACNGVKALDRLGAEIGAAVRRTGVVLDGSQPVRFLNWRGKVQSEEYAFAGFEDKYGAPLVSILRQQLHTLLRDAIASEHLHTGTEFTHLDSDSSSVTAHFADGSSATGDLLVGADGLRSRVRAVCFGDKAPRYAGCITVRGVTYGLQHAFRDSGFLTTGPGIQIFASPVAAQGLYWVVTVKAAAKSWPRDAPSARQMLQRTLAGWHEPVAQMIEQADLDSFVTTDIYDRDPLATWSYGRVTLLGDAVHPMTPHMGQGANMAVEDSICLARCLTNAATLEAAQAEYQAQRFARTARVAKQSRQFGKMGQIENKAMLWLMDKTMPMLMKLMDSDKQDRWLFGYNP